MFLAKILIRLLMLIPCIVEENTFAVICFQVFSMEKILQCQVKDCFEINGKQMIKMPSQMPNDSHCYKFNLIKNGDSKYFIETNILNLLF